MMIFSRLLGIFHNNKKIRSAAVSIVIERHFFADDRCAIYEFRDCLKEFAWNLPHYVILKKRILI